VAFTTDNLTPSVAKQYNIPRSKKRALLNISVLKKTADGSSKPTSAIIKGTATNLSQQLRELDPREISEKGAIYYIAETPVDNAEILRYNLDVTPEGENTTYTLSFQEQFYTE
jgi:translation initiation factor 2B subunit (eIF-2B alpha/beta/delta family)